MQDLLEARTKTLDLPSVLAGLLASALAGITFPIVDYCWNYFFNVSPPKWAEGALPNILGAAILFMGMYLVGYISARSSNDPKEIAQKHRTTNVRLDTLSAELCLAFFCTGLAMLLEKLTAVIFLSDDPTTWASIGRLSAALLMIFGATFLYAFHRPSPSDRTFMLYCTGIMGFVMISSNIKIAIDALNLLPTTGRLPTAATLTLGWCIVWLAIGSLYFRTLVLQGVFRRR